MRVLVPVIAASAGLLAATAVATSRGGQLGGQPDNVPALVAARQSDVTDLERQARKLRTQVDAETAASAAGNVEVRRASAREAVAAAQASVSAVSGPGLTVALDDAPRSARTRAPRAGVPAPTADDLVVHQQDVQAAVNGLRAGGARALSIMGQRVITTTAVRCVGNTLLVNGRVYSPPFVISAVGDPAALRTALEAEPGIVIYRQYVGAYGLRLTISSRNDLKLPAYTGPVLLTHAKPLPG